METISQILVIVLLTLLEAVFVAAEPHLRVAVFPTRAAVDVERLAPPEVGPRRIDECR